MTTQAIQIETREVWRTVRVNGKNEIEHGFIASIIGGPRDLLMRATEEQAQTGGAAYAETHWQRTESGWKAI